MIASFLETRLLRIIPEDRTPLTSTFAPPTANIGSVRLPSPCLAAKTQVRSAPGEGFAGPARRAAAGDRGRSW